MHYKVGDKNSTQGQVGENGGAARSRGRGRSWRGWMDRWWSYQDIHVTCQDIAD